MPKRTSTDFIKAEFFLCSNRDFCSTPLPSALLVHGQSMQCSISWCTKLRSPRWNLTKSATKFFTTPSCLTVKPLVKMTKSAYSSFTVGDSRLGVRFRSHEGKLARRKLGRHSCLRPAHNAAYIAAFLKIFKKHGRSAQWPDEL